MTKIPEWQEYCDLVEPDINLLKTVLENTDRNEFHDHVALEAVKQKYLSLHQLGRYHRFERYLLQLHHFARERYP